MWIFLYLQLEMYKEMKTCRSEPHTLKVSGKWPPMRPGPESGLLITALYDSVTSEWNPIQGDKITANTRSPCRHRQIDSTICLSSGQTKNLSTNSAVDRWMLMANFWPMSNCQPMSNCHTSETTHLLWRSATTTTTTVCNSDFILCKVLQSFIGLLCFVNASQYTCFPIFV